MKNYLYGAEMFDGVTIHTEAEIVAAIEGYIETPGQGGEYNIIPKLNDLIQYRKFQRADGQVIDDFKNAILKNYEADSNEDRLWNCFERALRAIQ